MSHSVQIDIHGQPFSIETGKVAKQADGAVVVRFGASMVLATVVGAKSAREGQDFFPLTVEYRERAYAGGRIPGGYFKREGAPVKKEVLTCRLIDRPIRPLFPEGFRNEIQVICLVISGDPQHDPDVLAMNGASAALSLSGIPFDGPVGAVRVGLVDGQFVANPTTAEQEASQLELVVAGDRGRGADGRGGRQGSVRGQDAGGHRVRPRTVPATGADAEGADGPGRQAALGVRSQRRQGSGPGQPRCASWPVRSWPRRSAPTKSTRAPRPSRGCSTSVWAGLGLEDAKKGAVRAAFEEAESAEVRRMIVERGLRVDGRKVTEIRPISAEIGVPAAGPRLVAVHARRDPGAGRRPRSAPSHDEQKIEALEGESYQPRSCCTTTSRRSRSARSSRARLSPPPRHRSRRARRARGRGGPAAEEDFPYTIRVVSDILESNGSSSMATVCGASLALMDAGVPIKAPVAGIAMGLMKEGDEFGILTDIMGDRGPLRRHGLQGRRHREGHHRAADGHQDRRACPRDHAGGAPAGPRGRG